MSELISSLFSQVVLMLVALVASAGSEQVSLRPAALSRPAALEVAGGDSRPPACSQPQQDACNAAARMRWQVTMHLPSSRRCDADCAG